MKATSNWLENHIPDAKRIRSKYNIIIAREFNTCLCGIDKRMPWYVVEDLQFFQKITTGSIVVMGRNTMESLKNKPLKNRVNVVISKSLVEVPEGFLLIRDLSEVSYFAGTVFFIGGPSLLASVLDKPLMFPDITLYLSELDIPKYEMNGRPIYLHDMAIFGRYRKVMQLFSSGWLYSSFSNVRLKFQGYRIYDR